MKKIIFTIFLIPIFCQAQTIDSLSILKQNDWRTLQWFDSDTVCMYSREKLKKSNTNLDTLKIIREKMKGFYGERISFNEKGRLEYTNHMSCPVGELLKKVYSIDLIKNKLIVDFESKKWPWETNEAIREKIAFEILKWDSQTIILKKQITYESTNR